MLIHKPLLAEISVMAIGAAFVPDHTTQASEGFPGYRLPVTLPKDTRNVFRVSLGILSGMPLDPFKNLVLTPDVLRLVGDIDEFKGAWSALGSLAPDRLATLRQIATVESVGASTRIEGARLTDREVDILLSNLDLGSFKSRDEQEVAGYAEATKLVFDSWRDIPLTENHIKQLHGTLLKFSQRDEHHRGNYKHVTNNVEAFDHRGRSVGVIFETATPFDTPRLMQELVAWTNRELDGKHHHPLLVVAVFIVRFLAVHPFQDGNGRHARVLTNLLLLRTGYTYMPYSSLERVVEENREQYYRSLRSAQGTLDKDEAHLMDWLRFFLLCLVEQKNSLAEKVKRERLMTALSVLDEQLLQLARQHGRLTLTTALALTKANRNTLKLHFRQLVQAGRLQLRGRGRSSWYEVV
jgi:Fic family protein